MVSLEKWSDKGKYNLVISRHIHTILFPKLFGLFRRIGITEIQDISEIRISAMKLFKMKLLTICHQLQITFLIFT